MGVAEAARVAQYSVVRVEVYIDPARGDNELFHVDDPFSFGAWDRANARDTVTLDSYVRFFPRASRPVHELTVLEDDIVCHVYV